MTRSDIAGRRNIPGGKRASAAIPGRKRKRTPRGSAGIIDQVFAKPVTFAENGSSRTASGLEVIVTQLVKKEMAGDRRAMAVRLKYEAFAVRQNGSPGIVIVSDRKRPIRETAGPKKVEADDDSL
jgi:hypothetical protein